MRSITDIVLTVAGFLNKEKINYVIVAGFAVSTWGEPRATSDIDFIILLNSNNIPKFANFLRRNDFQVSNEDIRIAFRQKSHFSVFDKKSNFLLDIKGAYNDFDRITLKRRVPVKLKNTIIYVGSPEDTIINKILFGTERDITDAKTVFIRQHGKLDTEYIGLWCKKLGIFKDYLKLRKEINRLLKGLKT